MKNVALSRVAGDNRGHDPALPTRNRDVSDMTAQKPDVLFYHLEQQPLERVLPMLLEKTLERGWRAVVQVASEERLEALDEALWTYSEDSFLPHGSTASQHPEHQPVYLTTSDDAPNGAGVRFLVDGAEAAKFEDYIRMVFIFDGADDAALTSARQQWKAAKAAGCTATYWQQDDDGRWRQKA